MTFGILFLGFGLGLLFVIPPGPIAVTLVEVGVNQGRSAGARSGMGIAAGDTVSGGLAGVTVASGGMLPTAVFDGVQITSAIVLIGLGAIMIGRPGTVESMAAAITRPARTFFFLTALTPTVFGAWLAILAAMPFAHHLPSRKSCFASANMSTVSRRGWPLLRPQNLSLGRCRQRRRRCRGRRVSPRGPVESSSSHSSA